MAKLSLAYTFPTPVVDARGCDQHQVDQKNIRIKGNENRHWNDFVFTTTHLKLFTSSNEKRNGSRAIPPEHNNFLFSFKCKYKSDRMNFEQFYSRESEF